MVDEEPVNRVFSQNLFKSFLVIGIESGAHFLIVVFGVFVPDVEGTIQQGLAQAIPEEAGAAVAPFVAFPAPERELGEIGNASVGILGVHIGEKVGVGLRDGLAHGGIDEITRESGGHENNQRKSDGEKSEKVGEAGVQKGKEIEKEDSADGEKEGVGQRKRNGELGERRAEKFTNERNLAVDEKTAAEEEEKAESENADKGFGPGKFLFEGVIKTGGNENE